jgi:hypothetical protein
MNASSPSSSPHPSAASTQVARHGLVLEVLRREVDEYAIDWCDHARLPPEFALLSDAERRRLAEPHQRAHLAELAIERAVAQWLAVNPGLAECQSAPAHTLLRRVLVAAQVLAWLRHIDAGKRRIDEAFYDSLSNHVERILRDGPDQASELMPQSKEQRMQFINTRWKQSASDLRKRDRFMGTPKEKRAHDEGDPHVPRRRRRKIVSIDTPNETSSRWEIAAPHQDERHEAAEADGVLLMLRDERRREALRTRLADAATQQSRDTQVSVTRALALDRAAKLVATPRAWHGTADGDPLADICSSFHQGLELALASSKAPHAPLRKAFKPDEKQLRTRLGEDAWRFMRWLAEHA